MKKTSLTKALALAMTGAAMTAVGMSNALASTTMYNLYNAADAPRVTDAGAGGTDGWTLSDGPNKGASGGTLVPWAGTTGYSSNPSDPRPFNYIGSSALNWAAHISQAGDNLQISQADSFARYGVYADIDTAGGAWQDSTNNVGWAHNTDIGLFKADVTTNVTLRLSGVYSMGSDPNPPVTGSIANFGITIFTGMDTGTNYSHHNTAPTAWNNPSNPARGYTASNPFKTTGVNYVGGLGVNTPNNTSYMTGITSANGFTFAVQAGVIYSIYLGGYRGIDWNQTHDGYALDISTTPVPIPAAVWLMGSALGSLLVSGRKKKVLVSSVKFIN